MPAPYSKNKECSLYLGVHVAERILSDVFEDVERMPMHNPGYDVICNKGKRVDIKSSCKQKGQNQWAFHIARNTIADYFLCLAFDNREDLNPLHVWLIPGSELNHLTSATISESTLHKWDEYSLDISKVKDGCNVARTANNRENTPPPFHAKTHVSSSRLSVVSYLKSGLNPAKIAAKMNVTDSTIQYHITILKKQGIIRKVGYGTWEVLEEPTTEKKTPRGSGYVGSPKPPQPRTIPRDSAQSPLTPHQQDAIRTHAMTTTWQVPRNLRNWNNKLRVKFLETNDIPYKNLRIAGGGQRIIVKGRKVQLLNKSIIIYDKASYFAATAREGKSTALALHLSIIKHIERLLHTSFQIGNDHKFKVSRQHHALIHNALAKQYNETGKKLEVRNGRGLWLLIDNSPDENGNGMNELEAVRSDVDAKKVKDFFNGLYDIPANPHAPTYTPAIVLQMIAGVTANQQAIAQTQEAFAANTVSHVGVIQELGDSARANTRTISELGDGVRANTITINDLGKTVQDLNSLMKQLQERYYE